MAMPEHPQIRARSRKEWRAWLQKHHEKADGVWLVFPKRATGLPTVSYNDAVEEALCFGWIDGLMNPIDATFYKQMFTPRKPKSAWAPSNKQRVERLIEQGLMTPAGMAAVETAKANDSWDRFSAAESLTVPRELKNAIDANAKAKEHWPQFTASQRRHFLYWLALAKRDDTRARRIAQIVSMAEQRMTPTMANERRLRERRRST
jgi:uncharacterized protein YdeI (YjbR/CyaY-like superfamily)